MTRRPRLPRPAPGFTVRVDQQQADYEAWRYGLTAAAPVARLVALAAQLDDDDLAELTVLARRLDLRRRERTRRG